MEDIKGIIFDLDGVIVFTDQYHFQAWKKLADRLGAYFDEKINDRLRGVSRMESLNIVLERYQGPVFTDEEKLALAAEKNAAYVELLQQMTPASVTDDVRETLKTLRQRGYLLSVGSSSRNTKTILARTELTDYFDAISDGTNISRSKPDPEVFVKAAEFLGLSREKCAVVEDAHAGIDAAKAANMLAVGIGPAASYGKTDCPITNFTDLKGLFL